MAEYSSVLQLIEDLNKQVYHFENMKSEQESRWKEFRAKEDNFSRLASEAAGVLDAVAGLVKNNEELKNHLFSLKDAFEDLSQRPPSNFYREDENGREDLKSEREDEVAVGYDEEEPTKREFAGQVMSELETSLPNEKQEQHAVEEYSNGQSEQEVELTANFPEAHHVELALAPWNWSSVPMERCDSSWKTRARIPSGNEVMFKFIVDGEWKCSQEYPIVRDHHNNENNFINCM